MIDSLVVPFLKGIKDEGPRGVNVLLYGPPGSGKTELGKLLIEQAGKKAYTLKLGREEKVLACWERACKLSRNDAVTAILIDEADDVFNSDLVQGTTDRTNKARINTALENTKKLTVWTTNSLRSMDAAIIRRFHFVLKVGYPPRAQMEKLAQGALAKSLSEENISRLVNTENLSPALVAQVGEIVDNRKVRPCFKQFRYRSGSFIERPQRSGRRKVMSLRSSGHGQDRILSLARKEA